MNKLLTDYFWVTLFLLATTLFVLLMLAIRTCDFLSARREIQQLIQQGRSIPWFAALDRCKRGEGVIILVSKRRPIRIWFVEETNPNSLNVLRYADHGKIIVDVPAPFDNEVARREALQDYYIDESGGTLNV